LYFLDFIAARVSYNSVKNRHIRDMYEDAVHAIYLLGLTNKDFLMRLFQNEVEKTDTQPYLFALSWMIGSLQDERAVEPLIKALKHKNENVRQNCCGSLQVLKSRKAIEALKEAAMDERSSVRYAAERALTEFGIVIPESERFVAKLTDADLRNLVQQGDRFEAIERVVEKSGWNFDTAKEYVDLVCKKSSK
jgi:hypothetical protein